MAVEAAVGIFRFLQYGSVSVLFGSALCLLRLPQVAATGAAPFSRWPGPLLAGAALMLGLASLGGLTAQAALLAGSWQDGAKAETVTLVISTMALGKAAVARAAVAVVALAGLTLPRIPPPARLGIAATAGAIAAASFAWSGHGAATEGAGHTAHLLADIAHSLAAALWIGALAGFAVTAVAATRDRAQAAQLHRSLAGFSRIGSWLVGTLVLTGVANAVFLAGTDLRGAIGSPYGWLLAFKLALFVAMLGLAGAHRWLLVPALGRGLALPGGPGRAEIARLRLSVAAELAVGLLVLAAVAWLGMLAPPGL